MKFLSFSLLSFFFFVVPVSAETFPGWPDYIRCGDFSSTDYEYAYLERANVSGDMQYGVNDSFASVSYFTFDSSRQLTNTVSSCAPPIGTSVDDVAYFEKYYFSTTTTATSTVQATSSVQLVSPSGIPYDFSFFIIAVCIYLFVKLFMFVFEITRKFTD